MKQTVVVKVLINQEKFYKFFPYRIVPRTNDIFYIGGNPFRVTQLVFYTYIIFIHLDDKNLVENDKYLLFHEGFSNSLENELKKKYDQSQN